MLKDAGAEIVAYVPNNAFLVKAGRDVAANVGNLAGVSSVLPYEPYYKLDLRLMKFAVDNETMPDDAWLRVTFFPGASTTALAPLANQIGAEEKSPFGEQILVQAKPGTLADLAQLPEVQIIEPWNPRIAANDLTRVALGISENTTTNANHHGLSGKDVWVNVNDIGVDKTHPSLQGRVFYNNLNGTADDNGSVDRDGHGTHVAATIAGGPAMGIFDNMRAIGTNSLRTNIVVETDDEGTAIRTNLTVDGSLTNADFRGMAHQAKLFVLSTESSPGVTDPVTDTYIIETAARTNYQTLKRTNETLISNNSWNYANTTDYDSQAARFDAATRDALPDDTAPQPITFVFAAGNQGFGGEDGQGGEPGTVASPGTAKNVITVGALEAPRFIAESLTNVETRIEIDDDGQKQTNKVTNLVQIFRPSTDSADQVASFSSRGNVGIGVEGESGRFKPDLVAPGTFIWSARSTNWNLTNEFATNNPMYDVLSNLNSVASKYRYDSGTSFSAPGVSGLLALVQEFFSHTLTGTKRRNLSPAMMKALLLNTARPVNSLYDYDPHNTINYQGWGLVDLRNLITTTYDDEDRPGPATLQALAEDQWPIRLIDQSPTNALATGEERTWNIKVHTNALAAPLRFTLVWTDPPGNPQVGVKLVNDLDLTVEVAGRVYRGNDFVLGSTTTVGRPPFTGLAIDDPNRDSVNNVEKIIIGDPLSLPKTNGAPTTDFTVRVSGRRVNVKAVNDYYNVTGRSNEIVQDYALVVSADNYNVTDAFPKFDRVATVTVDTNVFTQPIFNGLEATNQRVGANSPILTNGAVNLTNGVTAQWRFYVFTNNDKALNAGFGMQGLKAGSNVAFITSGPINVGNPRNVEPDIDMYVSKDPTLTNLNPAAIATAWKSTTRLGTEQIVFAWDDIIRDDAGAATTNRAQKYDPANTDLGGIITAEAKLEDVFYIGVKSEDQQAAEFTFFAISSQNPFEDERDGVRIIHMLPAPQLLPDGAPNIPRGSRFYGIPLRGGRILDANVYMGVRHEELGDLVGTLGHGSIYATLNNHSLPREFTNFYPVVYSSNPWAPTQNVGTDVYYNDIGEYPPTQYIPTFPAPALKPFFARPDGPRTLETYTGTRANSVWTLDLADSAPGHIGTNFQAEVHVTPLNRPLLNGETILGNVNGGEQDFYPLEVPQDATRVTITMKLAAPNTNIVLLVKKDFIPSTNDFDYMAAGTATTVTLAFDRNSQPPLTPGEYIVAVANLAPPSSGVVNYQVTVTIESADPGAFTEVIGDSDVLLKDDARTISQQDYSRDDLVTDASVAVLADHKRISDVVLRLTSPQGTSVILSENRGFFDRNGFGSTLVTSNALNELFTNSYAVFTDDLGRPIKFTKPPFGDFSTTRGIVFRNSFEASAEGRYTLGATFDGWRVNATDLDTDVTVVNGDAADGGVYLNLTGSRLPLPQIQNPASITRKIPTRKDRPYRLSFAYRGQPQFTRIYNGRDDSWTNLPALGPLFSTGQMEGDDSLGSHTNAPMGSVDRHYRLQNNPDPNFLPPPGQTGSAMWIIDTNRPPYPIVWSAGPNDALSQWIALKAQDDNNHPAGIYTNRTSFILSDTDPSLARIRAQVGGDNPVIRVILNTQEVNLFAFTPNSENYSRTFTISNGFLKGLNTLDFIINNDAGQPLGLHTRLELQRVVPNAGTNTLYTNVLTVGNMRLIGLGTNVVSVTGAPDWQYMTVEFVADKDDMDLEFSGGGPLPGVDIDDVILEDTGTVFIKPEEELAILEGERAMGEWKLEALDNRTGEPNPAVILDWQLILGTAKAPRQAEPLAAGANYPAVIHNATIRSNVNIYTPGVIRAGETEWFYYDVCPDATKLTVSLYSFRANTIPLQLLVDRSGFPTGDPARDDYEILETIVSPNASSVTFSLSLTNPIAAPLRPNKRIFFAVRGARFPLTTNEMFQLR
ncbi:MAG TPA: S8 family serine peptidase, partial [Verrucomicrobiae bacterium]|nr:S8 family serine peptidase [Verrucomicrobiae bacterium]